MKINLKLRFKNKTVLLALVTAVIAFVYQILGIIGITPGISESQVVELVGVIINFLGLIGILTDPTTAGFNDSTQALEYGEPRSE